eukprot:scaffold633274_cov23-Prasinocladus_malaysianus.AAC.1
MRQSRQRHGRPCNPDVESCLDTQPVRLDHNRNRAVSDRLVYFAVSARRGRKQRGTTLQTCLDASFANINHWTGPISKVPNDQRCHAL